MRIATTALTRTRTVVLWLVIGVVVVGWLLWPRSSPQAPGQNTPVSGADQQAINQALALEAAENQVAETVWAKELLAEKCGRVFEELWDSLNAASNKFEVLAAFPIGELIAPEFGPPLNLGHGFERYLPIGARPAQGLASWQQFLGKLDSEGWDLAQIEFRHDRFQVDAAGRPFRSHYFFRAHLANAAQVARAALEGSLVVDWQVGPDENQLPRVRRIDASGLDLRVGLGPPPFTPVLTREFTPLAKSFIIDPLILYDLDGDGLSEIILAAKNLVFRRQPGGQFQAQPLCEHPPGRIFTGLVADLDGDGHADFLCAKREGLLLFRGSVQGTFAEPARPAWIATPPLKYAQVMTCGDVDGDGDLDVWLGQYKIPYEAGQMPTPYYDANDGHPAYLLLNDGHGQFTDATEAAGLAKKRWRRTYSASLVDLDGDGDLDLMVLSDFAGVDLYANDGRGRFTDVTDQWVTEPHAFSMAHVLADLDGDGRLDFLMVGMNCPTAHRLDGLGLIRPGHARDDAMRAVMTSGNRLYLGRPGGGFEPGRAGASLARSGWSWGCSALDFDNDGFPDVYMANGNESNLSVKDYENLFWRHDIYVADSRENLARRLFFGAEFARTRAQGQSYGGYEQNRLFLNQAGTNFVDVGFLAGVAMAEDSRNVVADDLDGDGRIDLLVTTFEAWHGFRQSLNIFKNALPDSGNWIGFRFKEEGGGVSPVGVQVRLKFGDGRQTVRQLVTGDSYRSQHANTLHFGLGTRTEVEQVEVRWPSGQTVTLHRPAINRYHWVLGRPP